MRSGRGGYTTISSRERHCLKEGSLAGTTGDEIDAGAICTAPRRVEGKDKVRGEARFVGDFYTSQLPTDCDNAVVVTSSQASGTIMGFDAADVLRSQGVRVVMTHENSPRLKEVLSPNGTEIGILLPMQDGTLHYAGQAIAVVVADSLENARAAALLLRVRYSSPTNKSAFTLDQGADRIADAAKVGAGDKGHVQLGDPEHIFALSTHRVDITVETSPHHHNAMEPGGIVAAWQDDGGLTVFMPSQFCYGDAMILGQAFGFGIKERLPRIIAEVLGGIQFDNKIRVITPLAGGAFGSKQANVHLLLAAMAAKLTARPVKLVLTREQTFSLMPFRGQSQHRIRMGASVDGKLEAILQESTMAQGAGGSFIEPAGENTTKVYACKNILVNSKAGRLDTNAPGWMRGPGSGFGQFAVEVAIDLLAEKTGLDPLEIRLRNYAEVDPSTGHEWSSKSLRACYAAGAKRIGWHDRDPKTGSMREDRCLVGYGMATAIYPTRQMPAVARVVLRPDGHAEVSSALHEMGQGGITSMTQVAAERLGLPIAQVHLRWGDTALPYGSMNAGSMGALTNAASIVEACDLALQKLYELVAKDDSSSLHGEDVDQLFIKDGSIVARSGARESVSVAMGRLAEPVEVETVTGRTMGHSKYGRAVFGAQFVKVKVDPETRHMRVDRMVGAFAGGTILNPLMVRSQLMGSMVWGLGQALLEESMIDERTGLWMNGNLGEALVPTNADIPDIETILIREDDSRGHPVGAKGMGEIGIIGVPAAISNAIYHATGKRLLFLPMKIEHLF